MKPFDFDKSLNQYAQDWYEEHAETLTPEEMENAVEQIFTAWTDTPIKEIGASPKRYFAALDDEKLCADFLSYFEMQCVPAVLTDELTRRDSMIPKLEKIIRETTDGEMIQTIMSMLSEMRDRDIYSLYIQWLTDDSFDDEIAMHVIEIMQSDADLIALELEQKLEEASDKVRDRISDLIVYAKPTDVGFELLTERFLKSKDVQLYATYLGMYGMDRAIPVLKSKALECDYPSFVEIKNAVERLGGEMDIVRDFSEDPAYRKIKGATYVNSNTGRN